MSTYREIVFMIMDELKLSSDDSYFTEDHIIFLASKYRAFLLKQRYSDIKK
nr:MAG TPA: Structural protein [Crassvirales sp.]